MIKDFFINFATVRIIYMKKYIRTDFMKIICCNLQFFLQQQDIVMYFLSLSQNSCNTLIYSKLENEYALLKSNSQKITSKIFDLSKAIIDFMHNKTNYY